MRRSFPSRRPESCAVYDSGTATSRILIVEDDATVGPVIVAILERAGYDVELTRDLESAVAAAREHRFDLLLSDLVLVGAQDGLDVAEAVRAITPAIKVIFISGYGGSRYGIDPGDPVIPKPIDASSLITRVADELARGG
jgi:DNA-binding response OmpR family regulator